MNDREPGTDLPVACRIRFRRVRRRRGGTGSRPVIIAAAGVLALALPCALAASALAATAPAAITRGEHQAGGSGTEGRAHQAVGTGAEGRAHQAGVPAGLRTVVDAKLHLDAAPVPDAIFTGVSGTDADLGYSVALSGDGQTALVGDPAGGDGQYGVAYLYVASAGTWPTVPTATFTGASAAAAGLGGSVALSADGQTALVGAEGTNSSSGAAFLYTASSGWSDTPVATFTPANTPYTDFGHAVALSGDGQTALVGAYTGSGSYSNSGAAFLYTASSGWSNTPAAVFSHGPSQLFGESVSLSDDGQTALIGAPNANVADGAAYLYTASAGTWSNTPAATFTPAPGSQADFGQSVALSGDGQSALAGQPFAGGGGTPGAALLYTASSGWSNTPAFTFTVGTGESQLGWSVSLSQDGQAAMLGAQADFGAAYLFLSTPSGWSSTPAATYGGRGQNDRLGWSVAVSGNGGFTLAGAPGGDAAYLYTSPAPTTTSLSSSVNPSAVGQAVTYTATVSGPSGTLPSTGETVAFNDGDSTIAGCDAVELSTTAPYTAACTVRFSSTTGSPHSITATYSGDTANGASTSPPVSQTVNRATSATSITSTTSAPVVGQPISVAVQVTGQYPGSGVAAPSGSVTVSDGTRSCLATLSGSNGIATGSCAITEQAPGRYRFSARYAGDPDYTASHATLAEVTVAKAATTTSLVVSPTSVAYGDETTVQFTVTVSPQFTGTPAGQVTITSGTTALCTVTLSGGTGICSPTSGTALPVGTHPVTARYTGNASFRPSSARQTLKVTAT